MIRKFLMGLTALIFAVGCTTVDPVTGERTRNNTGTGAILGALGGAALGTLAGGNDRRNALIGAGVGALAGAAIGNYMDRQEQNLRERLAGTGVGVTRVSESQILLNFPADLTFDFNRDTVKSQFTPVLSNVANVLREYPQTTVDVYGHAELGGLGLLQPRPLRAPRLERIVSAPERRSDPRALDRYWLRRNPPGGGQLE